ncbi:MAG: sigma-54 dependent transcriptional regulator [Pseudomonadota bacterium]
MNSILIIDDDDQLRKSFEKVLQGEGYAVKAAASGEAGVRLAKDQTPDLVILDVKLPGMNGLETFQAIQAIHPKVPAIIMTAYGTTETAIEAIKKGAFDYILKPFDIPEMLVLIRQGLEAGRFMRSTVYINMEAGGADQGEAIIGRSKPMQDLYKVIGKVASTDATVLIRGESGTGKELVARAIYQHSLRSKKPFLVINCVAIPETLLESELFGYEKGAFTGAVHRRIGKMEQANGGTVFLDEIGDMPFAIQAKILRLLQEKSIERLGGRDAIPVDVRILAATNRDLESALSQGRFRDDLYYRLKVVAICLPPLRERAGDVSLLVDHFLARFSILMGIDNPGITDKAKTELDRYFWPGNVRELANVVQKALIFNKGVPISPESVSVVLQGEENSSGKVGYEEAEEAIRRWIHDRLANKPEGDAFDACMDQFERILITEALNLSHGNRSKAARLLGLSRPTLHSKIDKYQLRLATSVVQRGE